MNFPHGGARRLAALTVHRCQQSGRFPSVFFALAIYKELVEQGEAQAKNLRELGLENFEQRGIALIGNQGMTMDWVEGQLAHQSALKARKAGMILLPVGVGLAVASSLFFQLPCYALARNVMCAAGLFLVAVGIGALVAYFSLRMSKSPD